MKDGGFTSGLQIRALIERCIERQSAFDADQPDNAAWSDESERTLQLLQASLDSIQETLTKMQIQMRESRSGVLAEVGQRRTRRRRVPLVAASAQRH